MIMKPAEKIQALRDALSELGQDTGQWTDEDLLSRVLSGGPSQLPAWAGLPADTRLATLRAELAREGTDVTGLSDMDLLGLDLDRAWAACRRHSNAYRSLLQDQVRNDRSVRVAAHRSAVADLTAVAGIYLQAILGRQAQPIEGVIYRAEQIPEDGRVPVAQARELREAALRARWMLKGLSSDSAVEDATKDEGIQILEKLKAEIRRVAGVVEAYGTQLHQQASGNHTKDAGGRCVCVGCELLRSVNDPEEGERG